MLVGTGEVLTLIQDVLTERGALADGTGHQVNEVTERFVVIPPGSFVGGLRAGELDLVVVAGLFLGAMRGVNTVELGGDPRHIDLPGGELRRIISEGFEEVLDAACELLWIRRKRHRIILRSVGNARRHTGRDPGGMIAQLFRACNS